MSNYQYFVIGVFITTMSKHVRSKLIDLVNCGVDHTEEVSIGDIDIEQYAWLGVLWYSNERLGDQRVVTPVILIHEEFVLAAAYPIFLMSKDHFRKNTRVLLGEDWRAPGRRVRNYVIHPEYGQTHSTVALVHLKDSVRNGVIKPMCPPPEILQNPTFYVVKYKPDYNKLQKEVIPMYYVPPRLCRDFYVQAKLYDEKMRPPHVVCACSMEHDKYCIWDWGSALVTRDVWGRWLLLGWGVEGAGCSAPSRYLDMLSYYPWVHHALSRFQQITISKIHQHKYVLRSSGFEFAGKAGKYGKILNPTQKISQPFPGITKLTERFGDCDDEESTATRMFREFMILKTDNQLFQFMTYNMSILLAMEITCLTIELINASATSEMHMRHRCHRETYGPACYEYIGSVFDISVFIIFSDTCYFELNVWGYEKRMHLLDVLPWHWEEGTYYEDFTMQRVEYRGPADQTGFGFEPVDQATWLPEYDLWTTTLEHNRTEPTTTAEMTMNPGSFKLAPSGGPLEDYLHKFWGYKTRRPKSHTFKTRKPKKFWYYP